MVIFGIVSAWPLTHVANCNPAIFFCPSMHWKRCHVFHWKTYQVFLLKFFCPRQFFCPDNSNMLHMFKNNIYTDFRTAKTSGFLVMLSKWFNRTKVSYNWILTGCLAVKLRSKFETESSQPYFYLVFVGKKQ